jgi:SAM-dependent methyltransferase
LRDDIAREWDHYRQDPEEAIRGLFEWERAVLEKALRPADRILVVGCSTGRELIALAEQGYRVVGVDPSGPAVATARVFLERTGRQADLIHGFFEDVRFSEAFDVVVFSHRTYGLIQGADCRVGALRRAAGLLNPGGRVVLSYLLGPGMHPALVAAARLGAVLGRSDLRIERGDAVHCIRSSAFGFEHHFGPDEFVVEAGRAGLSVLYEVDGPCPAVILGHPDPTR